MLLNTRQISAITGLSQSTINKYANPGDKYKFYIPKLPIAEQRIENGKVVYYYNQADFEAWFEQHRAKTPRGVRKEKEPVDETHNV